MVQIQADETTERVLTRRRAILREASKCFRDKGFHATGMRDVAARLGVTVGSLYYYFRNKEGLLAFCQDETLTRLEALLEWSRSRPLRVDARLHLLIAGHVVCLNEGVLGSLAHLEVPDLEAAPGLIAKRDCYEQAIREMVREGIATGVFRPVDERVTAMAVLGAVNWTVRWYRLEGDRRPREIGRAFADQLVYGLLADGVALERPGESDWPDPLDDAGEVGTWHEEKHDG